MSHRESYSRKLQSAVVLALLAGCAASPVVESGAVQAPLPSPSPVVCPAPSVVPSPDVPTESPTPCDPSTAPFNLPNAYWQLPSREQVVLARCGDRYIQRVGESPVPLPEAWRGLSIQWLASDGSRAIGTPTGDGGFRTLVERYADGRPQTVLATNTVGTAISPDGQRVAYWVLPQDRSDEVPYSLYVTRTDVVAPQEVDVSVTGGPTLLSWSPDGQRLLFVHRETRNSVVNLGWASGDAWKAHLLPPEASKDWDYPEGTLGWSPDSDHVLVYAGNPKIPGNFGALVTLDLEGHEVSRQPLINAAGQPVAYFAPLDVAPGNPRVLGMGGRLLDTTSGRVSELSGEGFIGWSSEPGKLLRWRLTPNGPQLDTVAPDHASE